MKYLLCAIFLSNIVFAQDFESMFSPRPSLGTLSIEGMLSDPARSGGASGSARLYNDENQNFSTQAKWRRLTFDGSDSNLKNYDDVEFGVSYRRNLEDKRFFSLSSSYGSASDEIFKGSNVTTFSTTALMKFNQRWFGALNFSTNRSFAKNIPLPAVFYVHTMTREKIIIFGLPFGFVRIPIGGNFTFQYLGFLPWKHELKISYNTKLLNPYMFVSQSPESFLPYGRSNKDERFYWAKREAGLGLESKRKNMAFDLAAGVSFAQEFYIAEDFNDSVKRNIVRLGNSGFIRAGMKFSFTD